MGGISSREPDFAEVHTREVLDSGDSRIVKRKGRWFLLESRSTGAESITLRVVERRRKEGSTYVDFFDLREGPCDVTGLPLEWAARPKVELNDYARNAVERARTEAATAERMARETADAQGKPFAERRVLKLIRSGPPYEGVAMTGKGRKGYLVLIVGPDNKLIRFGAKDGWRFAE